MTEIVWQAERTETWFSENSDRQLAVTEDIFSANEF